MTTHEDDEGAGGYGQQPQSRPYGQQYGQPPYGQPRYGPQPYGQQPYPAGSGNPYSNAYPQGPAGYGGTGSPSRPGGVLTAAVLGIIFGVIGAIISAFAIVVGAVAAGASGGADQSIPGLGAVAGAVGGVLILVGILALAWTVVMIWGSVWAQTGRSRVLLLVGGSIALAVTLVGLLGNLGSSASSGGSVVASILFFLAALAIVALLSVRHAGAFFADHRTRRMPV